MAPDIFEYRRVEDVRIPNVYNTQRNLPGRCEAERGTRNAPSAVKQENMTDLQAMKKAADYRRGIKRGRECLVVGESGAEKPQGPHRPRRKDQPHVRAFGHAGLNQLARALELERRFSVYPE
jgi:hypothetical protein